MTDPGRPPSPAEATAEGSEPGPKVSLITICKNEPLIEETCRSVAAQVFDDFEWLVIDGASSDGALEILERYRNRMACFISEPDSGRYQAMNKGIRRAKGEYLLFLNGGDALADPLALERLFRYPVGPPLLAGLGPSLKADLFFGEFTARETGYLPWPLWPLGPRHLGLTYFRRHSLPHQATFIKRALFEKIGLYDETYQAAGDYEWFMRAILKHRATWEYVPLVMAVINFGGLSGRAGLGGDPMAIREADRAFRAHAGRPALWAREMGGLLRRHGLACALSLARLAAPRSLRRRWRNKAHSAIKRFGLS